MLNRFSPIVRKSIVAGRASAVRAYSVPNKPPLKREGPTAEKHHPDKFDDGRDDTHYQNQQTKAKAMSEDFPNKPLQDTEKPEPESSAGESGAFADHRGKGKKSSGEGKSGIEDATETRTSSRVGQMAKSAASSVFGGSKSFSTYSVVRSSKPSGPTHDSRTSPATSSGGSANQHPGYTTADAPIDSADPSMRPKPDEGAIPSSSVANASTKAAAQHPDVHVMADGANQPGAGSDSKAPSTRTTKVWGSNARSAQFNPGEGKRKAVLEKGTNDGKGGSKPST